eukprot:753053-Hanusia_phi.AAC.7
MRRVYSEGGGRGAGGAKEQEQGKQYVRRRRGRKIKGEANRVPVPYLLIEEDPTILESSIPPTCCVLIRTS